MYHGAEISGINEMDDEKEDQDLAFPHLDYETDSEEVVIDKVSSFTLNYSNLRLTFNANQEAINKPIALLASCNVRVSSHKKDKRGYNIPKIKIV